MVLTERLLVITKAAGMDYLLKRLGMSKRKTKHMTFALRREYMLRIDSELGYRSASFDSGDKTVISVVAHQTAAAALKERRREWPGGEEGLSTEHMLQLHTVVTSVDAKLKSIVQQNHAKSVVRLVLERPQATYARFEGFEHFASALENSTIERTPHHGDVSDEALALGGQTVEAEAPPTIDFRTLTKSRASFAGEDLSVALDYLNRVLSVTQAVENRENMPARTKKLHIEVTLSACFLDSLPPPSADIWTRCADTKVQRATLEALHRCLCVYSAAAMSLPADIDAVGVRAVTAATIFSIFEATLWHLAKDPLPLSAQLNHSKRHIPVRSYDGKRLAFHEASATMQMSQPTVLRARDAACEHLAAIEAKCEGNEALYSQSPASYTFTFGGGGNIDSTLEFMKDMCLRPDPCGPSQGGFGKSQFQKVLDDAPSLVGVNIPKEGMPPATGNGPNENLVGWLMDDGRVMKEWAWYRNAALLARLMLAADPKVDRTSIHSETSAQIKWEIEKSKWPQTMNSSIIVSLTAFDATAKMDFSAKTSAGNAGPHMYGIESSSKSRPASEDDVLHTARMENFDNALNDQETETLFGALVCEYVRVPMLLNFFDRDRLTCLCAHKIRVLLEGGIFEPGRWGKLDDLSNAFEFAPVQNAEELATEKGLLWNELYFSPASMLTPLFDLLDHAYTLAIEQDYQGPYVAIVLFIFRLHVHLEAVFRQVLHVRDKTSTDAALLIQLSQFRSVRARHTFIPWIEQSRSAHDTFALCRMMTHMLLSVPPLPKEDLSMDGLNEQDVKLLYPTMSYLHCWFPFGVKQDAKESSSSPGGLLDVSEVQMFALWDQLRDRALHFVSSSSSSFIDDLMNLILKTVTEGSQASTSGWEKRGDGRFEHPGGGIAVDLQTGEVFFKAGAGMKMPSEIAQHPEFKSIFGNVIPNCTPLVNCQAVSCFTASHNNVRYTFESWDNKKLYAKTGPTGQGASSAVWSVGQGEHFVNAPQQKNSQVVYCGREFTRTSVSQLAENVAVHPAVLAAIFAEYSATLTDDLIFIDEDTKEDQDVMLLKRLPCEPKDDTFWWIEFRCSRCRPAIECFELALLGRRYCKNPSKSPPQLVSVVSA